MVSRNTAIGAAVIGILAAAGGIYYGVTKEPEYSGPSNEAIPIVGPPQLQPKGTTLFTKRHMGW